MALREFRLEQNYPNPFNPSTTILFFLPQACHVTITLYDVCGREITRLVDAPHKAGVHKLVFTGGTFPSGVYFYRMQAGPHNVVRRTMRIK